MKYILFGAANLIEPLLAAFAPLIIVNIIYYFIARHKYNVK